MKKTTITMLLLLAICAAQAQKKKTADQIERKRFEIGTDLLPLIGKNNLPGYAMQFKLHNMSDKFKGAWRLKLGVNLKTDTITDIYGSTNEVYDEFYERNNVYYSSIGYEIQKQENNFRFFFGADLFFGYEEYYRNGFLDYSIIDSKTYSLYGDDKIITQKIGILPFFGGDYFINSNLSISIESSINILTTKSKLRDDTFYIELPREDNGANFKTTRSFTGKLLPISIINLNIHF